MSPINRHLLWRILSVVTTFLFATTQLYAFGDYSLKIDDEYEISRANDLQVSLQYTGKHDLVYYHDMFPTTGPIYSYKVTPKHIFLWVYGRKPRNLFPGDKYEDVDPSNQSYLILDKSNQQLVGPLNLADFQAHPIVQSFGDFSWIKTRNPELFVRIVSLIGTLLSPPIFPIFLLIGLVIFFRGKPVSQSTS